jgi:signal transduction histidine kinase
MSHARAEATSAIARARADLDRALAVLQSLAAGDRERFSYSVHALNNYLMVVSTTIEIIRRRLIPKGDRELRDLLQQLGQSTNLMMSTARGVLTASPERPPLIPAAASLVEIAAGACFAYRDIARHKRVRIIWKAPPAHDRVITDRVAAGAVLDNLLSNAVKYSPPGSPISVTTVIHLDQVFCSVCDKGPGLSKEDQAKLFLPGVPLSAQPTGGESSSGYGLAIANDLANALGGRLTCASVLGKGACFTFSLPLAP